MRFATILILLSTILSLSKPTPILDNKRIQIADNKIIEFTNKDVVYHTPDFPEMTQFNIIAQDKLQDAENHRIADEAKRLQALEATQKAQAVTSPAVTQNASTGLPSGLEQLKNCESGGDYAKNTGNGYYGAYQYDLQTWGNFMGYVRPDLAPPAVQDAKFLQTYTARGASPWPVCGRFL